MDDEREGGRDTRRHEIQRRLAEVLAEGEASHRRFEKESGVARATLTKVLNGDETVRPSTLDKIEAGFAKIDEEFGGPSEPEEITYTVNAAAVGLEITVKGPIGIRQELEDSVLRIIQRTSRGDGA